MSLQAFIVKRQYIIYNDAPSDRVEYVMSPLGSLGSESTSTRIEDAHVFTNSDSYIHDVYRHNVSTIHDYRGAKNEFLQTRINLVPEVK
jgi:hypothetical protein